MLMLMPSPRSLLDGGQSLGRAGDFDHYVLAAHGLPQAAGFVDRLLGFVREIGRNFEADISVAGVRAVVNAAKRVGGVLNVADGELLVACRSCRDRCGEASDFNISSYRLLSAMAFSKMAGLEVMPRRPSLSIMFFSLPLVNRSRRM